MKRNNFIVICPKCGEDNSDNFRFCGMCGSVLEARRPQGAPLDPLSAFPAKAANAPIPPISGPSMLGLNQPAANQSVPSRLNQGQITPNEPSMDLLREKSFSGLDSFFEPEQPKTGGRRVLILIVLLAALGGAGWWVYANYLNPTEIRKPEVATSSAPADVPSAQPATQVPVPATKAAASQTAAPPAATPPAAVAGGASENANFPNNEAKPAEAKPTEVKPAELKPEPADTVRAASPKIPHEKKVPAKREAIVPVAKPSPEKSATAAGDADFRKGEAYLYGSGGVHENCNEAVRYLKAASGESNAKARSTFGTMYATGHCVPRDLPTSYRWFAMASWLDPNNTILEDDLTAIWNQMTPPERQMATRKEQ